MGTDICLDASEKAHSATGKALEIFHTDQGCPFTAAEWTSRLALEGSTGFYQVRVSTP
jgi:hypothetical protein